MPPQAFPSTTSQYEFVFPSAWTRWVARRQSLCFASLRGLLNFAVVAVGLVHVGCPLAGALAQALAAGAQSAFLQIAPVNERYQHWLAGAPSERHRFVRWLMVGSLYLLGMKTVGVLAGIHPPTFARGVVDLGGTILLSTVQYPWVTAIARMRAGSRGDGVRAHRRAGLVADAQTVLVSVFCIGASALSSVGADFGRALLLIIGAAGAYYRWGARAFPTRS